MPRVYRSFTPEERATAFWRKVNKNGPIPAHAPHLGPCWEWTGARTGNGYGKCSVADGRVRDAHVQSYVMAHGEVPPGLELDHLCRNKPCVNPDHLEAVTRRENLLRANGWSGVNARKTHCKNGHPFDESTTKLKPLGRECRTCDADRQRAKRQSGKNAGACEFCGFVSRDLIRHLRTFGRHPHSPPTRISGFPDA